MISTLHGLSRSASATFHRPLDGTVSRSTVAGGVAGPALLRPPGRLGQVHPAGRPSSGRAPRTPERRGIVRPSTAERPWTPAFLGRKAPRGSGFVFPALRPAFPPNMDRARTTFGRFGLKGCGKASRGPAGIAPAAPNVRKLAGDRRAVRATAEALPQPASRGGQAGQREWALRRRGPLAVEPAGLGCLLDEAVFGGAAGCGKNVRAGPKLARVGWRPAARGRRPVGRPLNRERNDQEEAMSIADPHRGVLDGGGGFAAGSAGPGRDLYDRGRSNEVSSPAFLGARSSRLGPDELRWRPHGHRDRDRSPRNGGAREAMVSAARRRASRPFEGPCRAHADPTVPPVSAAGQRRQRGFERARARPRGDNSPGCGGPAFPFAGRPSSTGLRSRRTAVQPRPAGPGAVFAASSIRAIGQFIALRGSRPRINRSVARPREPGWNS